MGSLDNYEFCQRYMTDGEYILWKGRPEKGNVFTGQEAVLLPFSVIWLAFSVYWEMTALQSGASWFLVLWGIPFVGIGIYLLAGNLPSAEIVIHKNGCGTLKFGRMVDARNGYRNGIAFMIENVADVAQVQNALDSMDR